MYCTLMGVARRHKNNLYVVYRRQDDNIREKIIYLDFDTNFYQRMCGQLSQYI